MSEQLTIEAPEIRTKASGIGFGLSASNWDEGFRIAKVLAASTLVPKAYQGRPEDVVVAMQYGSELGLPPMAALQSIAVINGRPGVYGDGFLGVIMAAPSYHKHVEYYELPDGEKVDGLRQTDYSIAHADDIRAVTKFWRRGIAEPFVGTFAIGDAKRAKLWGKEGPWQSNPARMLKWRARGYAGRDGFAAELRGLKLAEELHDYIAETIDVEPQPIPPPVRRSEKARAERPPEATPDTGTVSAPPAPATTAATPVPPKSTPKPQPAPAPKPTPTPQPPPKATTTPQETDHLAITETFYETPKDADPFYEVRARVAKEGLAPIDYVFLTTDREVYELAASAEGSEQTFCFTWHHGKRPRDGSPCKVLDAISVSE